MEWLYLMEWLHVLECKDESGEANSGGIRGAQSLKAHYYGA